MLAKRKRDGKIIEVKGVTDKYGDTRYIQIPEADGSEYYDDSDLDFDVEEAEQTESAVISGWVTCNKELLGTNLLTLFYGDEKPIYDGNEWYVKYGKNFGFIPTNLFPSLKCEDSPYPVTITIKVKKK